MQFPPAKLSVERWVNSIDGRKRVTSIERPESTCDAFSAPLNGLKAIVSTEQYRSAVSQWNKQTLFFLIERQFT